MRLLQIEFKKMLGNKSFWIFSLIFLVFLPVIVILIPSMVGGEFNGIEVYPMMPKSFVTSWYYTTYVSSWFSLFILAFVLVYHISNEYAYRTVRQNVIDGLTRIDFIKGKIFLLVFIAVFATLYVFIIGLLGGLYFESIPHTDTSLMSQMMPSTDNVEVDFGNLFDGVENVFGFFIQIMAYFSFAMLLGFLVKKGALAILMYFASFLVERIIGAQLSANGFEEIYKYFPLRSFSRILPGPDFQILFSGLKAPVGISLLNVIIVLIYVAIFLFLTRLVFLKRDIN